MPTLCFFHFSEEDERRDDDDDDDDDDLAENGAFEVAPLRGAGRREISFEFA